ncbi:hypothetical protein BO78DRAFT_393671 [Aspergillus sclerotiicarbonarius CBS 121057]|uniref:DUF3074 domain-containing protein n=1 Tax=Aspergillus sclerotiicarbonarius (strain CBS 121057 / IBT 28362) TaxID=1448318 RepID=A0A319ENA9_ASPSB|nr:hypothetical protein BO78DRAFT_393671 [Aspergillus sclerotiicarbonarius CBS 121057]
MPQSQSQPSLHLQDALQHLSPTTWSDIPTTDPAALRNYLSDLRTKAHLIIDSVPLPIPDDIPQSAFADNQPAGRVRASRVVPTQPLISAPPAENEPNTATATATTTTTNGPKEKETNEVNEILDKVRKEWSKPIKITSLRDNPLQIQIYKLQGADGKGCWFGRRSVHEGLSFDRWREKLSGEMGETLRRNEERVRRGKMPDQAVRGIGAERLVGGVDVRDDKDGGDEGRVIGRVQVYHVSAQFPKPTAARDFVSLIVSWEDDDGEDGDGDGGGDGGKGREWMMVSRPCVHDEAPPVQGYIRGMYESVEFIREIPVEGEGMNPVEWVMVTRSDPGGNIPRWMVEKGTPKSICTDATKFLNWACRDGEGRKSTDKSIGSQYDGEAEEDSEDDSEDFEYDEVEHHGLIASFAYLVNAGLERYAPQTVLDYLPHHSRQSSAQIVPNGTGAEDEEANEKGADEKGAENDAASGKVSISPSANSAMDSSVEAGPDISALELMTKNKNGKLTSHEKQLAKLAERKRNVEAQLDRVRTDIQALRVTSPVEGSKRDKASTAALAAADQPSSEPASPASSVHKGQSGKSADQDTARMHKAASGLFHEESKLMKQLGKIEKDQVKEASKIEARQQKHADKQEKWRSRAESDALRREVEVLKKEVDRLRTERKQWLDLIGSLQNENTRLAAEKA